MTSQPNVCDCAVCTVRTLDLTPGSAKSEPTEAAVIVACAVAATWGYVIPPMVIRQILRLAFAQQSYPESTL